MKKQLLAFLLAACILALGLRVLAAGGSAQDPLISFRYLTNTFLPKLEELLGRRAEEKTQAIYQAAEKRLHDLGQLYLDGEKDPNSQEDWSYSSSYAGRSVKRGDVITLSSGSSLLWDSGYGSSTDGMVDVTVGRELQEGELLDASHCYLNAAEDRVTVTVLSDAASISVEGLFMLTESSEDVTGFTDLRFKDWFYSAVRFVFDQGLFNGVSDTVFSPNTSMDRSMLATVLYRMAEQPAGVYIGAFSDVTEGQWYTAGVEWAASCGVVTGYDDGTFLPSHPITREQIATMLYRYAGRYLDLDTSERGDLSSFPDSAQVSFWAQEAIDWAAGTGIMGGFDDGTLKPRNTATRAEVAAMLQRLMNLVNQA